MRSRLLGTLTLTTTIALLFTASATITIRAAGDERSSPRAEPPRPIVVDSWWANDWAKTTCIDATKWFKENKEDIFRQGCEAVSSCPELQPVADACFVSNPTAMWFDFQDRMATAFASDASCKSITIFNFAGPGENASQELGAAVAGPHWWLIIDFTPGHTEQGWTMAQSHFATSVSTKGQGTPTSIAHTLCAIVNGHGGTLK
jgi:hypothetical protein